MFMEVLNSNRERTDLYPNPREAGSNLLRVSNLSVNYRLDDVHESCVVKQVSFEVKSGEIVGLLGESGSGKTTTALALAALLPSSARMAEGSVEFQGNDLQKLDARRLRGIRGSEISTIYQDSLVLNPVMRAGDQVAEVLRAHRSMTSGEMRDEVCATLAALGLENCDRIFRAYPHQLSGGQRRRVAIAQALVCKPRLVIADEPTAWLDSNTSATILDVFEKLRALHDMAFLLISHDPETLALADRVMVMYAGQIVESGERSEVLTRPKHPYTVALLQCGQGNVGKASSRDERRLPCIPGHAPDPAEKSEGCSFSRRCCDRMEVCDRRSPELLKISGSQAVRCFKYGEQS
jgi:oligopeptide/dipeptide ABC transporter ATP-binding protein